MNILITILIFSLCFLAMAIGVIFTKKTFRKGCSADPDDPNASCACKANEEKSFSESTDDALIQIQPSLKNKKKA